MIVPLRVDMAGGWLDLGKFARPGAYIVNCTIEPFDAHPGGGLGGSARQAIIDGRDPFESEAQIAGWQDAAVITETGFCVWRSGPEPVLEIKRNPDFLRGRMALLWTGGPHNTAELVDRPRDYDHIKRSGDRARSCVVDGVRFTYGAQVREGMSALPYPEVPRKYCGSGWGGYALYLFEDASRRADWLAEAGKDWEVRPIEPYMRGYGNG